jgi:hypothetical protein
MGIKLKAVQGRPPGSFIDFPEGEFVLPRPRVPGAAQQRSHRSALDSLDWPTFQSVTGPDLL